jgi:hypothetical protein
MEIGRGNYIQGVSREKSQNSRVVRIKEPKLSARGATSIQRSSGGKAAVVGQNVDRRRAQNDERAVHSRNKQEGRS